MTKYALGFGSNLGNRLEHLQAAISQVSGLGEVVAISSLYESAPVGGPEQDPYLNAVVVLQTDSAADDLLGTLRSIESEQGRERGARWGPRTLDLDILVSDGPTIDEPDLSIPHPASGQRRFVLEPLVEVWPEITVSGGMTATGALAAVGGQEVDLLAVKWAQPEGRLAGPYWVAGQLIWFLATGVAMAYDGSLPGDDPDPSRLIGGLLILIGSVLAYTSMRRLGTGRTVLPEPIPGGFLVETGSYAHVRHPMYGGVSLVLIGTALVLDSIAGVVLGLGLFGFFWLKSGYEERRLRIAYPGYAAYRRRVPRRFIPFVL